MDIHPIQAQHQTFSNTQAAQPRDLTWLGMADDHKLLYRAREIVSQNAQANPAALVFEGLASKLSNRICKFSARFTDA